MSGSSSNQEAREQLLAAMPVTERHVQLAGVSTAVLEGGAGSPIVLLHGHGEFAALWMRVIPDLVRTHRVIAPDLPGHGDSEVADGSLDTGTVLTWLDELVDQTCESKPVLAGHLLGGAIAARYAVGWSDRLAHLLLVDTLGLGWFRPAPGFAIPLMGFLARPNARSRDRLFNQCFVDMDRVREQAGEQWEPLMAYALDRARTPSVQAAQRRLIPRVGVPPISSSDLERITVPTTLIHGRHDLQVRLRAAEAASAKFAWPLHVIEDCGDDPAMEQPHAFLDAVRRAIATSTGESEGASTAEGS